MQRQALVLIVALFLGGSVFAETPIRIKNPLGVFALCIKGFDAAQNVDYCQKLGFDGIGLESAGPQLLQAYTEVPAVKNGSFRVFSALWWFHINDTIDPDQLQERLKHLNTLGAALWIVAAWDQGDRQAAIGTTIEKYKTIAAACRTAKVQMVLYPHVGCVFETASEALDIRHRLAQAGYPEVAISILLCHELKRGRIHALKQTVAAAAGHLALVHLGGANTDADTDWTNDSRHNDQGRRYWDTAIMPLDQGSYDVTGFLKILADAGYQGPIQYMTYHLQNPAQPATYDHHLERSIAWWKSHVQR